MLVLLSSLIGLLGSAIPNIFKAFQDTKDKAQELAIMGLQLEIAKLNIQGQLQSVGMQTDLLEQKVLYSTYETGYPTIDKLNGLVRPVISFSFFFTYVLTKVPAFIQALHDIYLGAQISHLTQSQLWGDNDSAIFAAIIAFYFGSRAFQKRF